MTADWHVMSFAHPSCGKEGRVLQVAVRADGVLGLYGYCMDCEEEFGEEFLMAQMVARSAIKDYEEEKCGKESYDLSGEFVPSGLPA